MVPSVADQVTDLSETVPWTLAVNCALAPVFTEVDVGDTEIDVTTGGGAAVVTLTLADPDTDGLATLVAVTVSLPALAGAVYWPAEVIVPSNAFQVTDLLEVDP